MEVKALAHNAEADLNIDGTFMINIEECLNLVKMREISYFATDGIFRLGVKYEFK